MSKPIVRLPNDVLSNIFNKLPFNSMIRLKLLSKEWYSIISNPKFIHDYFNQIGKHFIFSSTRFNDSKIYEVNCSNFINNTDPILSPLENFINNADPFPILSPLENFINNADPFPILSPLENSRKKLDCYEGGNLKIIGSCNGSVALANRCTFILWNPLLNKEYKLISGVNWFFQSNWDSVDVIPRALYYDDDREEYNMVVMPNYHQCFCVVDFKTGKYRKQKSDALTSGVDVQVVFNEEIGKVVCGVPHWVVKYYYFSKKTRLQREILYFDRKNEEFKKMARPCYDEDGKVMVGLATLEGERQLGIVLDHVNACILEVWVMKEYGETESWTNLFMISYSSLNIGGSLFDSLDVLGFMPNGELLIKNYLGLRALDLENGTARKIHVFKDDAMYRNLVAYEPSLTSNTTSVEEIERRGRNRKSYKCVLLYGTPSLNK